MDEKISWNTKNIPAKVVVEGGIVTDYCYQMIKLTESGDYFLNATTKRISNASVIISDGTNEFPFTESATIVGSYYSNEKFAGEPGKTYTLHIDLQEPIDNISTLTANDQLVQGFKVDSMFALLFKNPLYGLNDNTDSTAIILVLYGNQLLKNDNYYLIQLYRNGQAIYKNIDELTLFKNENTANPDFSGMVIFIQEDVVLHDKIAIDLMAISKEYYEYIREIKEIVAPPDPLGFSGPPADAIGNVNNGSRMGFFYTEQISRATTILREP